MMQRTFFSAFAAILLSAVLVQTAAAYPSTATSGRSTVTGTYRPLSLDLDTLVEGADALDFRDGFSFQIDLTGTFKGDVYDATGDAGLWRIFLSDGFDAGVSSNSDGNTIYMGSTGPGLLVGTLTYLSGGDFPIVGHPEDTPEVDDVFGIYTTAAGNVLTVDCDNISTCGNYILATTQALQHLGPFTYPDGLLDEERTNLACFDEEEAPQPCGTFTLEAVGRAASSVPEPATLALLGLGLVGLGLSRRARA